MDGVDFRSGVRMTTSVFDMLLVWMLGATVLYSHTGYPRKCVCVDCARHPKAASSDFVVLE